MKHLTFLWAFCVSIHFENPDQNLKWRMPQRNYTRHSSVTVFKPTDRHPSESQDWECNIPWRGNCVILFLKIQYPRVILEYQATTLCEHILLQHTGGTSRNRTTRNWFQKRCCFLCSSTTFIIRFNLIYCLTFQQNFQMISWVKAFVLQINVLDGCKRELIPSALKSLLRNSMKVEGLALKWERYFPWTSAVLKPPTQNSWRDHNGKRRGWPTAQPALLQQIWQTVASDQQNPVGKIRSWKSKRLNGTHFLQGVQKGHGEDLFSFSVSLPKNNNWCE